ncbi:hypothetical protein AVEN_132903-1 [Araneus ventricosus]|uniref:Uncharacterized protein n=1 Tax=Araneus ventricosus TaxID=182803 RepID=A0A4Y2IR59_ARAVE|nr:hypothetical protein AVEN_132903-1 [Araneus ventricosus]
MYTKTERWAAQSFNKFDFEEELVDGTLFEKDETRWILKESPERTTKAVPNSLEDDGLKRKRSSMLKRDLPSPKKRMEMKTQDEQLKFGWF